MLAAMLVVMFFGSTRFEETAALSVAAVEMMSSGNLRINFAKGKCNQTKELQPTFIYKGGILTHQ